MDHKAETALWAGIFGAVIALAVVIFPADGPFQGLVVGGAAAGVTAVVYFLIRAADQGQQVRALVVSASVALGCGVLYGALLVADRDARIANLERAATATATAAATVTVSASSQPLPSVPTGSNPASAPPSTASSTPTSTPALTEFDPSEVAVRTNGTTALTLGQYGLQIEHRWGDSNRNGGTLSGGDSEIVFRESGMSGREGTQFALVRAGAKRSFPTCQAEKSWLPSLGWNQLAQGTFLCLKTPSGRRGLIRIDKAPDLDSEKPWIQVTGVTWEPVVDR